MFEPAYRAGETNRESESHIESGAPSASSRRRAPPAAAFAIGSLVACGVALLAANPAAAHGRHLHPDSCKDRTHAHLRADPHRHHEHKAAHYGHTQSAPRHAYQPALILDLLLPGLVFHFGDAPKRVIKIEKHEHRSGGRRDGRAVDRKRGHPRSS